MATKPKRAKAEADAAAPPAAAAAQVEPPPDAAAAPVEPPAAEAAPPKRSRAKSAKGKKAAAEAAAAPAAEIAPPAEPAPEPRLQAVAEPEPGTGPDGEAAWPEAGEEWAEDFDAGYLQSKYTLVSVAAKRARQILGGSNRRVDSLSEKPVTVALEELAQGKLYFERTRDGIK